MLIAMRVSNPFYIYSSIIYACSTNAVESVVKLITCNDVPASVEEWHIPGKTAGK